MIIECISDLHGHYPKLDGGDLLIVAGDLTARHTFDEMVDFEKGWLRFQKLKYKKIILIAGNHDTILQELEWNWPGIDYLCDSGTEFEGLKIWGSPWTRTFPGMNPHCKAFTVDTEEELAAKFSLIPEDIDILITHNPPYAIRDMVSRPIYDAKSMERSLMIWSHIGSNSLYNKILKIRPKLHVFGHIHECYGEDMFGSTTHVVNASHVDGRYHPVNKPIRVIL